MMAEDDLEVKEERIHGQEEGGDDEVRTFPFILNLEISCSCDLPSLLMVTAWLYPAFNQASLD